MAPLLAYEGDFGSLFVHFKGLWDHCGIIMESLGVYEGTFSKITDFPTYFNDFIKIGGKVWITLASFWDKFGICLELF